MPGKDNDSIRSNGETIACSAFAPLDRQRLRKKQTPYYSNAEIGSISSDDKLKIDLADVFLVPESLKQSSSDG